MTALLSVDLSWFASLLLGLLSVQCAYALVLSLWRFREEAAHRQTERDLLAAQIEALRERRERAAQVEARWEGWRKFRVVEKVAESDGVTTYRIAPHDGRAIPGYLPGQFLTFRLRIPGRDKPVVRCYSLSDAPGGETYRVSIKAVQASAAGAPAGVVSNYFEQSVNVGDLVDVGSPSGKFCLDPSGSRPVVLIGAGIGVTPLLAMVNALAASERLPREVHLFQGARSSKEHFMRGHLRELAQQLDLFTLTVCYSNPLDTDQPGVDFEHHGRIGIDLIKRSLPSSNYEFYVCGPSDMMEEICDGLAAWGVPSHDLHFESFGPSTVKKLASPLPSQGASIAVRFARSGKEALWDGRSSSLLELAEASGITVESGCRAGSCNTCVAAVKSGDVSYTVRPSTPPDAGLCLLCIATPTTGVTLDL